MSARPGRARRATAAAHKLDFIVIGAQKAGTTTLFEHLRSHPELYLPPGKEQHFFSCDEIYDAGWSQFAAATFGGAPEGVLWGKVTPGYMAGCPIRADRAAQPRPPERTEKIIPERIRATCPDVKLIAILRDPVERCISHYRMSALGGSSFAQGSIDQVMADLLTPATLEYARRIRRAGFITWGEYGRILEGYYATFPRQQIFVCFTTELETAPRELMRDLFSFLGVDTDFVPQGLGARYRAGAASPKVGWLRSPSDLQKALVRQPVVRSIWRRLPASLQQRVIRRLREANYRFDLWNRRERRSDSLAPSAETLAMLRAHYENDRAAARGVDRPARPLARCRWDGDPSAARG